MSLHLALVTKGALLADSHGIAAADRLLTSFVPELQELLKQPVQVRLYLGVGVDFPRINNLNANISSFQKSGMLTQSS